MQAVQLMGMLHLLLLHHTQQAAVYHAASSVSGQPMRILLRPLAGPHEEVEMMDQIV